jgi:hypothetical protein
MAARNRQTHTHEELSFQFIEGSTHESDVYTTNTKMYTIMLRYEVILFSKRVQTVEFAVNVCKILKHVVYGFKLNCVIEDK